MKLKICLAAAAFAVGGIPVAHAVTPPPNFPDLTNFDVVTASHQVNYQRGTQQMVTFSTPDGVRCSIYAFGGVGSAVRCYGAIPGLQAQQVGTDVNAKSPCGFGMAQLHAATPGVLSSYQGDCPSDLDGAALLTPGQKVRMATTICGVAPGEVTACIDSTDGGHGFVLQPSGSWTF
ncbi:hypothetical protein OS121_08090 [Mycolicibacterium mucogenicum]|uniref:hypothetical protein n=1 Tax=Mycolicibacterium mucogenicum TaxID=56689 RepID=UPI00226A3446|nr:hypothetical protein [Mycolicibacterium mucogenicum]MCX8555054.1 hypothetical protein [Mycolicibacterium mucogenicum]